MHIVLVHGAYADGSSWSEVIPLLQRAGHAVDAVQNPLTSLADDVAATRRAIELGAGPALLVGHSWAGTVISEAGDHPAVVGLVFVTARAPDASEDYGALAARYPAPPASAGLEFVDGFGGLTEEAFVRDFANGLDPTRARALHAVQGRVAKGLFESRTTVAAWRDRPTWYAIARGDRTTSPDLERFLAERMGATAIELDGGHLLMLTHPRAIADLILSAVAALDRRSA